MNIKTTKQLPLLITFALLTACSSQNTSVSGSQSSLGGQQLSPGGQSSSSGGQSIPGSQLLSQQNKDKICVDKATGKAIPGCKSPTTIASNTKKASKLPSVPAPSSKMRKIVLKAPKKTITPRATSRTMAKPIISKPRTTSGMTSTAPRMRPNSSFGKTTTKPRTVTPQPRSFAPLRRPAPVVQPTPRRATTPVRRPAAPVRRPTPVVRPSVNAGLITNPVRSAPPPARPVRPVVKPVVRAPVKKPQSTLRRLTLNGSANFKSGSSRLTSAGQTKLLVLSLSLQEGSTQISRLLIEGHTDSVGNAAMNQVLSLKRANAVAEYLAKKGGFVRSIMSTVGLGESKPVASNKTKKGRAQNRRVEITATGTRQINR